MIRKNLLPLSVALWVLPATACLSPIYQAETVGYALEAPSGFLKANSHKQFHLDDSVVGPVDLAITRFTSQKDAVTGGAGETYVAVGMRGAFDLTADDNTAALLERGLDEALVRVGKITTRRRIDQGSLVGLEITVEGSGPTYKSRAIHLRVLAGAHSAYFLTTATDASQDKKPIFVKRRNELFDQFRFMPVEAPELPAKQQDPTALCKAGLGILFPVQ